MQTQHPAPDGIETHTVPLGPALVTNVIEALFHGLFWDSGEVCHICVTLLLLLLRPLRMVVHRKRHYEVEVNASSSVSATDGCVLGVTSVRGRRKPNLLLGFLLWSHASGVIAGVPIRDELDGPRSAEYTFADRATLGPFPQEPRRCTRAVQSTCVPQPNCKQMTGPREAIATASLGTPSMVRGSHPCS